MECPVWGLCGSMKGEMLESATHAMTSPAELPDGDLVRSYAREGSESAFRALVGRHVNLVFATAFRQTGDSGWAEEITQNVFVALARKAPRLAGFETLAGWLHRTAVLEAKCRIRAELRRRRREEVAADLAEIRTPGRDPVEDLVSLLDEALMGLRETDRVALMLRFLEERSLRDVGAALGIPEEAARKRVSRALERVTGFFRQRGFALPATGGAAVLGQAVHAAPLGLAPAVTSAGLAAGGAATGIHLVFLSLMSLTKVQTTALCLACVALPLAWQGRVQAEARRDRETAAGSLRDESELHRTVMDEVRRVTDARVAALSAAAAARERLARRDAARANEPNPSSRPYRWSDDSPLARIPKELLRQVSVAAMEGRSAELTPEIESALLLTETERIAVRSALERALAAYHRALEKASRPVEPTAGESRGTVPGQTRVFETSGLTEPVLELRETLFADLASALDPERSELLRRALDAWMPVDDAERGINSGQAIFLRDHRYRIFGLGASGSNQPEPLVGYAVEIPGKGSFSAHSTVRELPAFLRPIGQSWIDAFPRGGGDAVPQGALPGPGLGVGVALPPPTKP